MSIEVASINELTSFSVESLNAGTPFKPVVFTKPITYSIKLEGSQWDGYVDVKIAQFVIDLQNSFRKLADEMLDIQNEELLKYIQSKIVVKVQIEKGCTKIIIEKIDKILEVALSNLTGWQKVVTASIFAALITGGICHNNWIEYQKSTLNKIQDEETKRTAIEMIEKRDDLVSDFEKPVRGLVQRMAASDKITLPYQETSLTKDQAKVLYPRRPRLKVQTGYIDDRYVIPNIKYDDDGTVYFNIEINGGQPIRASVDLNQEATDQLYGKIKECHQSGCIPEVDLHVTAKYTSRGITSASVVGLGEKRNGSKQLMDLF